MQEDQDYINLPIVK